MSLAKTCISYTRADGKHENDGSPCTVCGWNAPDHADWQGADTHKRERTGPDSSIPEFIKLATANDKQVGGSHYKTGGEEHWDRVWRLYGRGYFIGQITKYVERAHKKNGVQDLEKAKHFLEKYIELENGPVRPGEEYEGVTGSPTS